MDSDDAERFERPRHLGESPHVAEALGASQSDHRVVTVRLDQVDVLDING
jgi:hypothetical protein